MKRDRGVRLQISEVILISGDKHINEMMDVQITDYGWKIRNKTHVEQRLIRYILYKGFLDDNEMWFW